MDLTILSTEIKEPVTVAQVKDYMGYTEDDQDDVIFNMIRSARKWLEDRTGLSSVSKSYKAYFEKEDRDPDGWFELPVQPVLASPAITITINGTSTTFEQKGLRKVLVKPDNVIGTLKIGASGTTWYMEVTFQAGETNRIAEECIKRIVSSMFNNREDGGEISLARMPYDTLRLIESLDTNTGL